MIGALFSRIVVGADGSDVSIAAIRYAARLAREHQGTLIICNAIDTNGVIAQIAGSGAFVDTDSVIDGMREAGETILHDALAVAAQFGVTAERRLIDAEAAKAIMLLAKDEMATLIVMGTHGRSGLPRLFMGSTTEALLRRSIVPVLTVRYAERPEVESRRCIQRVIVGLDDSEPSDAALDVVFDLPPADRIEVLVYSVADTETPVAIRYSAAFERAQRDQARAIVDHAEQRAHARGVQVRSFVPNGRPADTIVEAAQHETVDLIVVGSHGRRGLRRFLLGSVAERVVRMSAVPTLVVRTHLEAAHAAEPALALAQA